MKHKPNWPTTKEVRFAFARAYAGGPDAWPLVFIRYTGCTPRFFGDKLVLSYEGYVKEYVL